MNIPLLLAQAQEGVSLLQALLPAAGIALIVTSLLMAIRKRRRGGGGGGGGAGGLTAREHLERLKTTDGMRGDLETLMVEIEELARRLGAQLDAKAVRLETLIDQAEAAARRLEKAQQTPLTPSPTPPPAPPPAPPPPPPPATPGQPAADPLTRSVYALADEGHSARDIALRLGEHTGKIELILGLRPRPDV